MLGGRALGPVWGGGWERSLRARVAPQPAEPGEGPVRPGDRVAEFLSPRHRGAGSAREARGAARLCPPPEKLLAAESLSLSGRGRVETYPFVPC